MSGIFIYKGGSFSALESSIHTLNALVFQEQTKKLSSTPKLFVFWPRKQVIRKKIHKRPSLLPGHDENIRPREEAEDHLVLAIG
jgi:hypothetical protein